MRYIATLSSDLLNNDSVTPFSSPFVLHRKRNQRGCLYRNSVPSRVCLYACGAPHYIVVSMIILKRILCLHGCTLHTHIQTYRMEDCMVWPTNKSVIYASCSTFYWIAVIWRERVFKSVLFVSHSFASSLQPTTIAFPPGTFA